MPTIRSLIPTLARAGLLLAVATLPVGCGEDPMGPDNRIALMALTKCRHDQALLLTDNAIERGNEHNIHRAWALKAAILRDRGDDAGAEALYPQIAAAWEAAKRRKLTEYRRERDISLYLDVVKAERLATGRPEHCSDLPPAPIDTGNGSE